MKEYWSSRIRALTPYTPGEQPRVERLIKLNTNESPYPPSPRALEALAESANASLRLYPDPEATALRAALSEVYGVPMGQIFVGNGSDEVLAFAFQAFFGPGDTVMFPDITYSFYPVYANLFGIRCETVPLNDDFTVPVERFCGTHQGIVLANPNAPTGIELAQADLRRILDANPDVVVIVDEAYVDFGGTSALPLTAEYPNLLVVQTMSKSRSLAGLRVGFAFGNENLIQALNCVKNSMNSYTLDRLAIAAAAASVRDTDYFRERCAAVAATRTWVTARLTALGFTVLPSKSNFLFITHPSVPARQLFADLRKERILVRYFDLPRIDNYLRVTVGSDGDMERFCEALERLVGKA